MLAVFLAIPLSGVSAAEFDFVDGDRVVLVGNTLIERDQRYGYLETRLVSRHPDCNLTFRNLGWSGDTVFGHARAGFDTQIEGYQRLKDHVLALDPTVIVVGYGTNAAFAGRDGLDEFLAGLNRLLDDLATSGARFVILSPLRQENLGPPLPDPAEQNGRLRLYCDALADVAQARGYPFIDLYERMSPDAATAEESQLTDDGMHLTEYGYWRLAEVIDSALLPPAPTWIVDVNRDGTINQVHGTKLAAIKLENDVLRFELTDAILPIAPAPSHAAASIARRDQATPRILRIAGLPSGAFTLKIDQTPVATATAKDWAAGVEITSGPEFQQIETLRETINAKNRLYFYRWRPQNVTYLFGFRKHEQGQNAVEIPQFDPLVAEKESQIAELRVPATHRYELSPSEEVNP